jgi:hypothetical protein
MGLRPSRFLRKFALRKSGDCHLIALGQHSITELRPPPGECRIDTLTISEQER